MDGKLVVEFLELDEELAIADLLWKHTASERLYLLDRRARLIKMIERGCELEQDDCSLLLIDGDDVHDQPNEIQPGWRVTER
jgi:hypothetical protein